MVEGRKNTPTMLYNMETDPYEMKNLIDHPASQATLEQLKKQLAQLLE